MRRALSVEERMRRPLTPPEAATSAGASKRDGGGRTGFAGRPEHLSTGLSGAQRAKAMI